MSSNSNGNDGNANNRHLHMPSSGHDVPPPPYSETDIYSSNSVSGEARTPLTAHSSLSAIDDAASSTTTGEVIYTPPHSPRFPPSSQRSAASFYFDSRPAPRTFSSNPATSEQLVHPISVNDASLADHFPYQYEWAARDVTAQDWATFINYLLPDHASRGNEAVLHRKLQEEGKSNAYGSSESVSQARAQLGQYQAAPGLSSPDAAQRRRDLESTVQQWNDGFFGPRNITVRLLEISRHQSLPQSDPRNSNINTNMNQNQGHGRSYFTPGSSNTMEWNSLGGIRLDSNGMSIGNNFVANTHGLRVGNLVMDGNGIRMHGGRPGEHPLGGRPNNGPSFPQHSSPHEYRPPQDEGVELRGRRIHHFEGGKDNERRARSSSSSSASSKSSSSSDSSIGSLPDYDSVPQRAMPVYVARLEDWTAHPDRIRSKADVKQLKAELKSISRSQDPPIADSSLEKKALKGQIKALTAQWKQIKRQQKRERRELKRERRERRRAERKERKQQKKEMKKAKRDARHRHSVPAPPPPPPPGVSIPPPPPPPPPPGVPPMMPSWGFNYNKFSQGYGRGGNYGQCRGGGHFGGPRGGGFLGSFSGPSECRHPHFCQGDHSGDFPPFNLGNLFTGKGGMGTSRGMGVPGGASDCRSVPGAWPDDKKRSPVSDSGVPPPGPATAARYQALEAIEVEIGRQREAAARAASEPERRAHTMAIDQMTDQVERLRLEADEAYARDLARQEGM